MGGGILVVSGLRRLTVVLLWLLLLLLFFYLLLHSPFPLPPSLFQHDMDVDETAWEFGLESPTAKSLKFGKQPTLPDEVDEMNWLSQQQQFTTDTPQGIPTLHLEDHSSDGPPFIVPRHSQVTEMIHIIHALTRQRLQRFLNPRIKALSTLSNVLWKTMLDQMDPKTAQREGGITFQAFPNALHGALNLSIRNQMQVLLLFRALDVDGDGVISQDDCKGSLPNSASMTARGSARSARLSARGSGGSSGSSGSRGNSPRSKQSPGNGSDTETSSEQQEVMAQDIILADRYLNAVADKLDEKRVTVKNMYSNVVRQAGRSVNNLDKTYVTKDEFIAFMMGWVPKHLCDKMKLNGAIVECVMEQVDINVDQVIGWHEFQSSFVAASGRRLLRLKSEAERLQESRLPSLLPRYKATIATIGRCQQSTRRLFRATTEIMFDAPESSHAPSEEDVLQKYIVTLGQLRVDILNMKSDFENAFLRNDELPLHLTVDKTLETSTTIHEHAIMIGT